MTKKLVQIIIIFFILSHVFIGCATTQVSSVEKYPLRVGITPNYPPIIFKQGNTIVGVEADLANMLAKELGRNIQFIQLAWDDQIPALLEGKTDIIMSGMSVTKARGIRIAFADSYLKSGLVAAMRAEDRKKYTSKEDILESSSAVGAVKDTTAHAFVERNFPNAARKSFLSKASDGASELTRRSIDIFINDAPSIIWLVSENEADLAGLWEPLNEEYLAWGVRKDEETFLMQVNSILERWKKDGILNSVLLKWLPEQYFKRLY
jgi:ABC-type amino acid transport substrate-binding protein